LPLQVTDQDGKTSRRRGSPLPQSRAAARIQTMRGVRRRTPLPTQPVRHTGIRPAAPGLTAVPLPGVGGHQEVSGMRLQAMMFRPALRSLAVALEGYSARMVFSVWSEWHRQFGPGPPAPAASKTQPLPRQQPRRPCPASVAACRPRAGRTRRVKAGAARNPHRACGGHAGCPRRGRPPLSY
jgi:hypothetical protein